MGLLEPLLEAWGFLEVMVACYYLGIPNEMNERDLRQHEFDCGDSSGEKSYCHVDVRT